MYVRVYVFICVYLFVGGWEGNETEQGLNQRFQVFAISLSDFF